ncbi:hypothetical protein LL266_15510 [Vibrio anguillarum]|nr:hypothetical protein [Vibrio anguillarum]NOI03988.1 hypothetical protein [Vibrio anguillarum]OEE78016.1 hypothetical protein A1QQ_12695 [Vibrio ordalii FF-167]
MNTISAPVYVSAVEDESQDVQRQSAQRAAVSDVTPNQPLPGSAVSLNALWRLIEDAMKEVANATSGTGKENSAAKKSLIDVQKESQIKQLKDRENQIEKQKKAQAKQSFWSKFTMALGFIAAIVIAPFNPVMAAIMIVTMVASIAIPKIADEIMKSAGVPQDVRDKVKMGLEIGIGIVGMLSSFNPAQLVKNMAKMAADTAIKAATMVERTVVALRSMLVNLNPAKLAAMLGKLGKSAASTASKATKLLDTAIDALKAFKTTALTATKEALSKAADKVTQVVEHALNAIKQMKATLLKALDSAVDSIKSAGSALKEQLTSLSKAVDKVSASIDDLLASLKSLNPSNLMNKMSQMVDKMSDLLNSLKAMRPSQLVTKAKQMLDDVADALKDWMTNSDKVALRTTRVNQAIEVSSNVTSVVSTGYGIKSADISKDMEIAQAKQEALETQIQQILMMLSQAMRAVTHAFESLSKTSSDFREFNDKMISTHM